MKKHLLALSIVTVISGCNSSDDDINHSLDLRILHINDHHSKLDATEGQNLTLGGVETKAEIGGFSRLVTKFNELDQGNVLKLHAGDAITGTMYYSLFREELPDALMMNQVCFDAFALGNHEFDDGNEQLAHFIDTLKNGEDNCGTEVLAANIEVPSTNPIYGMYMPYKVFTIDNTKVGVIGIDISSKTQASSSPSEDTIFLDEVSTAQKYINMLRDADVKNIILLTHYTYENDIAMAKQLTGVDVIVGGDSHSLLGNSQAFDDMSLSYSGEYPTIVKNVDGDDVCIVQAWDNARALGELNVSFSYDGKIASCSGQPHLMLGDNFEPQDKDQDAHTEEELAQINSFVETTAELSFVAEDDTTSAKLAEYAELIDEKKTEYIGSSASKLCNERVPGQGHSSGDLCGEDNADRDFLNAHGSVMANVVSKAFAYLSLRSDIAIQNSGGVRNSIPEGNVTVGHAFDVLPFTNFLVNLDMTGQEIVDTIEDALDNVVVNNSTGAFPSAHNLRFNVDLNQDKGKRISEVQVRRRGETEWSSIVLTETYVVVTNDFIAAGGDRYDSMVPAYNDPERREDTGLLYTDSLMNYIRALEEQGLSLEHPTVDDMMVQSFIGLTE
ncbi:5'-nucleotidase C-terminal domain-containing protein [Vibrio astriarenae]